MTKMLDNIRKKGGNLIQGTTFYYILFVRMNDNIDIHQCQVILYNIYNNNHSLARPAKEHKKYM